MMADGTGTASNESPSPWVMRFAGAIPEGGTVLDLACGAGRHTRLLLGLGHPVVALDRDTVWLGDIAGTPGLTIIECDLEAASGAPPAELEDRRFAGIVVTNYLHRPLLPWLVAALEPGGTLVYETFAQGNERFGHPRNPDFLLRPGELLAAVDGSLEVLAYEFGCVDRAGHKAVIERIAAIRGTGAAPVLPPQGFRPER